jgi:nucleoside-diphosphate-sugar epimerase
LSNLLVAGAAGFICSALSLCLLKLGDNVIWIDNHNDYSGPALKKARSARQLDHPYHTHHSWFLNRHLLPGYIDNSREIKHLEIFV